MTDIACQLYVFTHDYVVQIFGVTFLLFLISVATILFLEKGRKVGIIGVIVSTLIFFVVRLITLYPSVWCY